MNRTSNTNLIKIIGKFANAYGYDSGQFDTYERAIIEQCVREWAFYHGPSEPVSITGSPLVPASAPVETGAVREPARASKRV